jgi:hypothetical protein
MLMLRRLLSTLAVVALAACGGGSGSSAPFGGTPPGGSGPVTPPPAAADFILETSATQISNTATSALTITVTAVNASRVVVAGVGVTLSADNDGVISQSSATTDANGRVTGSLGIGGNRANRVITITAVSGTVTKTAQVQVVGTTITSTLVPAVVAPSTAAQVQYRVVDQTGNPMVGQTVAVSAPGLTPASATGVTGSNGEYTFAYTSAAATGTYTVATTIAGITDSRTVTVQSAATVPTVTVPISSASVSANPSVVGVNLTASSSNRSEIRALFLTTGNQPVRNVRVRFDLAGDANGIGGSFSTGSSLLYSDANGVVTTAYIPAGRSSPTNGVTVRACFGARDDDPALATCSNNATVSLTVVSEPLGVSIGTNEFVVVGDLTYTKRFLVSVADSAGNAKADVGLSVSLDLPIFRKGRYVVAGTVWTKNAPVFDDSGVFLGLGADQATCLNEDSNRNGVLEAGEDRDSDGRLDPGRSDVTVRLLSPRTGPDGTAVIEITYAKSFATWVDAWITVAASGVSGTEGRATYVLSPVPAVATAFTTTTSSPAFQFSPYGLEPGCANPR